MKCFFAISGQKKEYVELIKTLVRSAQKYTDLDLYCICNGLSSGNLNWLKRHSVSILKWEISFIHDFYGRYDGRADRDICKGMYLCTELPLALAHYQISDPYILYVDVDTMFCGPIDLDRLRPRLMSCTPDWAMDDWSRFGTGIILMNVQNMQKRQQGFQDHLKLNNYNFEYLKMGPCDQGAWNSYFHGDIEKLDPLYDWKPWWGINKDVKIVHFAGPKPAFIHSCLNGSRFNRRYTETEYLHKQLINEHLESYRHYLKIWENI